MQAPKLFEWLDAYVSYLLGEYMDFQCWGSTAERKRIASVLWEMRAVKRFLKENTNASA